MNPCSKCGTNPRLGPYGNQGKSMSWCRSCLKESTRRWHHAVGRRFTKYGVTREDVTAMRLMQGYRCDVCGDNFHHVAEHIDHDHKNGQVRALLCGPCNQGLGNFKDNPQRLRQAAAYLERWAA